MKQALCAESCHACARGLFQTAANAPVHFQQIKRDILAEPGALPKERRVSDYTEQTGLGRTLLAQAVFRCALPGV